jgi:hypothetical protein
MPRAAISLPGRNAPLSLVEYQVTKEGSAGKVFEAVDDLSKIPGAALSQVTIQKFFDLRSLTPGRYTIKLKVTYKTRGDTVTQETEFTVI